MFTHKIKTVRQPAELMKENTIVKHYAGSISYGTNLPTSDVETLQLGPTKSKD